MCLRQLVHPRNTRTPAREHMHAVFGNASRMWSGTLTEDQRQHWCAAGPNVMSYPRLAQKGPLSGQQFWQAINSVRGCVGLPPVLDPPVPVTFGPNVVGQLTITNDENGVRLWLTASGDLTEDVMVSAQAPCPSGRYKRRNVSYLGLLPPPIGGRSEVTHLYKAKYGEPRPGRKVFVVTCQQKDGWKAREYETSALVPNPPAAQELAAAASLSQMTNPGAAAASTFPARKTPADSQKPLMHKGGTRTAQGKDQPPGGHWLAIQGPGGGDGTAPGRPLEGGKGGNPGPGSPG